jgi:hypothetical protein
LLRTRHGEVEEDIMRIIDYSQIERVHAAARRERSEYVHCLFQRLALWMRAQLPHADPALRDAACCQPA